MARFKKKKNHNASLWPISAVEVAPACVRGPRAGPVATLGAGLHPGAERENLGQQAARFDSA